MLAAAGLLAAAPALGGLPAGAAEGEAPAAAQRAFFDISVDRKPLGRIVVEIPAGSPAVGGQRFLDLAQGKEGVHFRKTRFELLEDGFIQDSGLKVLSYQASGRTAIAGGDDTELLEEELAAQAAAGGAAHSAAGLVSLLVKPRIEIVNKDKLVASKGKLITVTETFGEIPNGTSWAITTQPIAELDETHLVVGRVVEGMDVVAAIAALPRVKDNTSSPFFQAGKLSGDKRADVAQRAFNKPYSKIVGPTPRRSTMVRAAALAVCLLALAASAAADCTDGGTVRLEYVGLLDYTYTPGTDAPGNPAITGGFNPTGDDARTFLKCLTSFNITFNAACDVTITPAFSGGGLVPGLWSGDPTLAYKQWVECPTGPMTILKDADTKTDVQTALSAFVYGWDETAGVKANRPLEIVSLDFKDNLDRVNTAPAESFLGGQGLVTITVNTPTATPVIDGLIFAITYTDLKIVDTAADPLVYVHGDDLAFDGSGEPLTVVNRNAMYGYGLGVMYKAPDEIQDACDPQAIGTLVGATPSLSGTTLVGAAVAKICHWCPAGTSGQGYGCTTCPAGTYSVWGDGDCKDCPAGSYSNAGSSECIPCPTGTYAPVDGLSECLECPEDSYSWIPGAEFCLRCNKGIPEVCNQSPTAAGAACPTGTPVDGVPNSSPGTHIIKVNSPLDVNGGCDLYDNGGVRTGPFAEFEIYAYSKCLTWADPAVNKDFFGANIGSSGTLQLALTVGGDCSILVSPITDESCANPTDPRNVDPADATNPSDPNPSALFDYIPGLPTYGQTQWRMYYKSTTEIRSLFDTSSTGTPNAGVKTSLMAALIPTDPTNNDPEVTLTFFGATTDPRTSYTVVDNKAEFFSQDGQPLATSKVCSGTATLEGGSIAGIRRNVLSAPWTCPAGSYYDVNLVCPLCPVGHTCPGDLPKEALVIPCRPNEYNPFLGMSGDCEVCPNDPTNLADPLVPYIYDPLVTTWTSYEGAAYCTVERVDLVCLVKDGAGDLSKGYQYDVAGQECVLCPPGTYRDIVTTTDPLDPNFVTTCQLCPAGTYSGEGATECTLCPAGQYNPLEGLPDQTDITGVPCILCAEGSVALTLDGNGDDTALSTDPLVPGATYCEACAAGTYKPADDLTVDPAVINSCTACAIGTYRAGDATPENNVCKPIPAGYRAKPASATVLARSEVDLCPKGQVSFYGLVVGGSADAVRIPVDLDEQCMSCSELDGALGLTGGANPPKWAHTFAPRKGMTQCIPCPGGTIPKADTDVNGNNIRAVCAACPNGQYRDAYIISATCIDCGPGMEVGPSSKMACTMCRPGYFNDRRLAVDQPDASLRAFEVNTCKACPAYFYRATQGALSCLPCPRGTQTANSGNVECTACPIGYYNNEPGTKCEAAKMGTFVNTTGAYVSTPCPKGTWNNEEAGDNCNPCAPGKYSNNLGSKECKTCAAGTYSAGQSTACKDCRPSYFAPAGAAACSPCKPGTYAPDGKSATCKLCPKGYQCPTNAMKAVGGCPRGTFSNKEGNKQCTPCAINTYSNGGGAAPNAVMACIKCPPGTNTRGLVGQNKCQVIRPQVKRLF
ncbi:peptidyl-prolyl cis-trans cyclophilin-type [Micractinium conductrix]|uniref:Peptidyl-prolyl cis-trans cyclophilin-type n=1 Tax=Micractinium conductrix TaxID=554055 RepID=A0A2P6VLS9_9CHLO|nr:peptidyl-prolyl cis-trans cyclophilin-type [Micractinium conductrix]|eukprot:PSC75061.1 peptidyl-prolyl cis-trans cyclophilin-type [Micractinium conductrix]